MVPKESGFNQSDTASCCCARAHCDVFQAGLLWQGMAKVYKRKAAFLSSRRHNLPSKVRLRNDQTPQNVYTWMQQ